jgi:hypothetical protein
MIIVGILAVLVVGGVAAIWVNLGNLMQAAIDTPEGRKGFADGFKKTCVTGALAAAEGKIGADVIATYCDCAATRASQRMSGSDIAEILKSGGDLPPSVEQQLAPIIAECRTVAKLQ